MSALDPLGIINDARQRAIDPVNYIKTVDTSNPTGDHNMGNAGRFSNGVIYAVHVTDTPQRVVNLLVAGTPVDQGREMGKVGDLGSSGLYFSATPQLWLGRATEKWSFLNSLTGDQLKRLANKLKMQIDLEAIEHYISSSERDIAHRDINYVEEGLLSRDLLVQFGGQPYNISFWKPDWLEPLGITASKPPVEVPVELEGKFADLTNVPITDELIDRLKSNGYDGAFNRGGWARYPEGVVWNNRAIIRFNGWQR